MPFGLSLSTVKLIAYGVVALAFLALLGHDRLMVSARNEARAEVGRLTDAVNRATDDIAAAKRVNADNLTQIERIRDDARASVAAVVKDSARTIATLKANLALKEKIHAAAQVCTAGNVGPYRALVGGLLDAPDPAAAGGGDAGSGGSPGNP